MIDEKAKNAFLSGEAFLHACHLLARAIEHGEPVLSLVLATNSAFSLEMFLKSVLLIEQRVEVRGHDVHELFHRLLSATKERLTQAHAEFVQENPIFANNARLLGVSLELENLLERGRNAFVDFRYAHERLPVDTVWGLNGFTK
ncbi:MAG: hypothetical protein M3Z64_10170, partial [Verrucomicrobiota bacterium]|nr:hypothetical protein [Verrucomicrobiota bacterium]